MNPNSLQHTLPQFIRDDLDIILGELCAGYREDIADRLRDEYTDHYTAAFEDVIAEGWAEEMAHKKALQDLGWETTLKVARVCRTLKQGEQMLVSSIVGGSLPRLPTYPGTLASLLLLVLAMFLIVLSVRMDDWLTLGLCLGLAMYSLLSLIRDQLHILGKARKAVVGVHRLQSLLRTVFLLDAAQSLSILTTYHFVLLLYEVESLPVHLIGVAIGVPCIWFFSPVRLFVRTWNRYYPDDRIS